jgi:hypothetical protein
MHAETLNGGLSMENILRIYKKQVDECRLMAAKTRNETLRVRLTELAQRWIELAEEREEFLKARPAMRN